MNHGKRTITMRVAQIFLGALFFVPGTLFAQDNLTISVTPPFFQMTLTPGDVWSSEIKVVNVNDYPLVLYANPVNFEANNNENGKGKFTPLLSEDPEYKAASLAGWIDVTSSEIHIGPGQTVKVPFSIRAPEDASPGGHYAAILIGNQPSVNTEDGPAVAVSTLISSLIFARVAGEVDERGDIRELSTDKTFYQEPEVEIDLRFENTGNVHLLPQGQIAIYNMWGKERGIIPVNQRTTFGNVLPKSTRKFEYTWKGERSPLEIGRYTVETTLSFGSGKRQSASSITSFWVVPLVPVASVLGVVLLIGLITAWFIRRYIRKALGAEKERLRRERVPVSATRSRKEARRPSAKALATPLVDGVMDLRNIRLETEEKNEEVAKNMTVWGYITKYKMFFAFVGIVAIAIFIAIFYLNEVLVDERPYDIEVDAESVVPFSS